MAGLDYCSREGMELYILQRVAPTLILLLDLVGFNFMTHPQMTDLLNNSQYPELTHQSFVSNRSSES